jgi:hypothetical protein
MLRSNKGSKDIQHFFTSLKTNLMKTFNTFVGIDISKLTIDVSVLQNTTKAVLHLKADNTIKALLSLFAHLNTEIFALQKHCLFARTQASIQYLLSP